METYFLFIVKCIVLHGNYAARQLIHKYELKYSDEKKDILKFDIIITTYEMVGNEPFLFNINWRCLIVDEAHKLKVNDFFQFLKIN